MKINKILKTIIFIITFVLVLSYGFSCKVVEAEMNSGTDSYGGIYTNIPNKWTGWKWFYEVREKNLTLYVYHTISNPNVYCLENGVNLVPGSNGYSRQYYVSAEQSVDMTDLETAEGRSKAIFAYILNYVDNYDPNDAGLSNNGYGGYNIRDEATYYKHNNKKQNAIWYFLQNAGTSFANTLRSSGSGAKDADLGKELYDEADQYVDSVRNASVSITSMEKVGERLKVTVSNSNCEKYKVKISSDNSNWLYYGNTYTGGYVSIPLSSFSGSTAYVQVEGLKTLYSAKYYTLTNSNSQNLIAISNMQSELRKVDESDIGEFGINADVSLQKYITKVTNQEGIEKYNSSNRKNKGTINAYSGYDRTVHPLGDYYAGNISKDHNSSDNTFKDWYPVVIDVGDWVTYTIEVYNNSIVPATNIKITDNLPTIADKYIINNVEYSIPQNGKIEKTISSLAPGVSTSFEVKVHINEETDGKIWNIAEITSCLPGNNGNYRIKDADAIRISGISVSLEKFVSKINGEDLGSNNSSDANIYSVLKAYLESENINNTDGMKTEIIKLINKSDFNNDGNVNQEDIELFGNYLDYGFSGILEEYLENYSNVDINLDGNVDENDLKIIQTIADLSDRNKTKDDIEEYLENYINNEELKAIYDLNDDGIINSNDIFRYWILKNNINNDREINEEDLYTLLLMTLDLDGDNKITNKDLIKFKSYIYKKNQTAFSIRYEIETYLKYDFNNDGIVNEEDVKIAQQVEEWFAITSNVVRVKDKIVAGKANGLDMNISSIFSNMDTFINSSTDRNGDNIIDKENDIPKNGSGISREFFNKLVNIFDLNNNSYVDKRYFLVDEGGGKLVRNYCSDYNIAKVLRVIDGLSTTASDHTAKIVTDTWKLDINSDGIISIEDINVYDQNVEINNYNGTYAQYLDTNEKIDRFINLAFKYIGASGEINLNQSKDYKYSDLNSDGIVDFEDILRFKTEVGENFKNINFTVKSIRDIDLTEFSKIINIFSNTLNMLDIDFNGSIDNIDVQLLDRYTENMTVELVNRLLSQDRTGDTKFNYEDIDKIYKEKLDLNGDDEINQTDTDLLAEIVNIDNIDDVIQIILNETDTISLEARNGKRYNKNAENKNNIENYNPWKKDNPVLVEPGDDVTFTIRLKNTGGRKVKITEIWDTYTYEDKIKLIAPGDLEARENNTYEDGKGQEMFVIATANGNARFCYSSNNTYLIKFDGAKLLNPGEYVDVEFEFKVYVEEEYTNEQQDLINLAQIKAIENINGVRYAKDNPNDTKLVNEDKDGLDNNSDWEFLKTKIYQVKLEKFVYSVNGSTAGISGRVGHPIYNDTDSTKYKYDRVVSVNKDNYVTYEIQVTNTGARSDFGDIKELTITDNILGKEGYTDGTGFEGYYWGMYSENANLITEGKNPKYTITDGLRKGQTKSVWITLKVSENNISLKNLINEAQIEGNIIINRNDEKIKDLTPEDNKDRDYINMKDIIISGTVWNDKAFDKQQNDYNGLYDDSKEEQLLKGIKVSLYMDLSTYVEKYDMNLDGKVNNLDAKLLNEVVAGWKSLPVNVNGDLNNDTTVNAVDKNLLDRLIGIVPCQETYTDDNGYYKFEYDYIKASKVEGTNRWNDNYYNYYIVFEYDGVKYTSTPDGKTVRNVTDNSDPNQNDDIKNVNFYEIDSNAKEDNGRVSTTRKDFNDNFNTNSGINYNTVNEESYIPQSIHNPYGEDGKLLDKYKIQSSTNLIELSDNAELENQLKYVNLGLRGRDIFDLELTSDVDTVKVTVNNKQGVYKYSNKVKLRQVDLESNSTTTEDMANISKEASHTYVDEQNQNIRNSDFNVDTNKYDSTQGVQNIEVTYKITVHNTSSTAGKATKITNYFDTKYSFDKAYVLINNNIQTKLASSKIYSIEKNNTEDYCKYVTITIPDKMPMLSQSETVDIYVVYKLNTPINSTLSGLAENNPIPTYNMAEITAYTTACADGQTEYTRGLIDKDSAPESVFEETVRLTEEGQRDEQVDKNKTTLAYYFEQEKLSYLKYEDDTYATPTLYFVIPSEPNDYSRKITGTVFEDITVVGSETKIKTGNGKLDDNEVGIKGATVELVEKEGDGVVRQTVHTNENGYFEFVDFLPGDYIIRYYYGHNAETALINDNNKKSYNGEDFQSTNNRYAIENMDTNILNSTENFWYIYNENEGISTATDNTQRRIDVSTNAIKFTDYESEVLNNMRNGKKEEEAKVTYEENGENKEITVNDIINATSMNAETPQMELTVEKTELVEGVLKQKQVFDKYEISNMNFGIAELPKTKVTVTTTVDSFTIMDATRENVLASVKNVAGVWQTEGDVLPIGNDSFDVSIEDKKLQGARLEVTYKITSNIDQERNFDNAIMSVSSLSGLINYIDNNLHYNPDLNSNNDNWEVVTFDNVINTINDGYNNYEKQNLLNNINISGTVAAPNSTTYNTIVKAKEGNLLLAEGGGESYITLEKVLSSTDSTLEEIISSTVDIYEYGNVVEITGFNYYPTPNNTNEDSNYIVKDNENTSFEYIFRDRVLMYESDDNYGISLPGIDDVLGISGKITEHTPTGDSSLNTMYYVIALIALSILVAGVFSIKKFVLNSKK